MRGKLELACMDGGKCIRLNRAGRRLTFKTQLNAVGKAAGVNATLVKIRKACRTYRQNSPAGGATRAPRRAPVRRR